MNTHLTRENVELYVLEKLSRDEFNGVEEHLLICGICRAALEQEENFISSIKAAILREEIKTREKDCIPIRRQRKPKT